MSAREFQFCEGSSSKFWKIHLAENSYTVHFGRIGTAGQVQTKEFASAAEAAKTADKLIAEKLKKGYVEQGASGTAAATSQVVPEAPMPHAQAAAAPAPPPAPVETVVSEPRSPSQTVRSDTLRELALDPRDWHWASWRPRRPLPRPAAPPFDLKDAQARLGKVGNSNYLYSWEWAKASISPVLSPEEAHFWLLAMTQPGQKLKPKLLAAKLGESSYNGRITLAEARKRCARMKGLTPGMAVLPLANLFGAQAVIDTLLAMNDDEEDDIVEYLLAFHREVLPYLGNEELEALREHVRLLADPTAYPITTNMPYYPEPPAAYLIAAALGIDDVVRPILETFADDRYPLAWEADDEMPQLFILGLADPRQVEGHMRRLKLRPDTPEWVRGWLAHTEFGALDLVRDAVLAAERKEDAESLIAAFGMAKAPETACFMLELMLSSRAPAAARQWLDAHPLQTAVGLIPVAAGRGKQADAALELLRALSRRESALLAAALDGAPEDSAAKVRGELQGDPSAALEPLDVASTPSWLADELATVSRTAPPAWVTPSELPPLPIGERRLSDRQVTTLLAALARSSVEQPSPLVAALKANLDRSALDRFAWRLFELWLSVGAPPKEKWALLAVGQLGSDASALKLAPQIRAWPGESQHQRAVLGLECLRAIGTDTALMQINGIAQKSSFKGLKSKAGECMEAIAKDRGFTRPQLEDRIVPDCDLDAGGSRLFDFGPRQFRFVLGPQMKPMVRESDGKLRPDLPKPNAKDDPTLAGQAVEEWKLLKKLVADVVKTQAVRLEQAMVTGRRWPREDFEALLVRHPLMTNLVRLLVWGAYDENGALAATFRVTEDQTCATQQDEEFRLDDYSEVGIVHPLHLSAEDRSAWGELISDYELVPPFSQLGRSIYGLEAGEPLADELKRWANLKVPPQSLVFTLEKLDWQRGIPEDGGVFYSHSKPFYGANVTAVVEYDTGVSVGYVEESDDQKVTTCYFIPGIWRPEMYPDHKQRVALSSVDPVVISEVLNDIQTITAKAR